MDGLLAIITGATSGIGYELAKLCAQNGYDLLIATHQKEIRAAAQEPEELGVHVDAELVDFGDP